MSKILKEAIIKPKPIEIFAREKVLYIPFDSPSRFLQKTLKKNALKEKNTGIGFLYLFEKKIVLYQTLGAPAAVLLLERLIVSGAKKIILLGFCGSLQQKFKMLNVISISKAFSEEGTSRHYFPRKKMFFPSPALKEYVESVLLASKLPFHKGSLVSTDAPYRETRSWLEQKQKRRIDVVDMEASAVFALAQFHGIQAAALMAISDELWSGVWKHDFHSPDLEKKLNKYFIPFIKSN
jgi:purine-nucleoside phosphorylase